MKKLSKVNIAVLSLAIFLSSLAVAFADTAPNIPLTQSYVTTSLCNIVNWMFYGLIILSVMMILLAGYNYVTSNGDAEKVSKAGKMILYAAIGIFVGLLAKGFPTTVATFVSPDSSVHACESTSGSIIAP